MSEPDPPDPTRIGDYEIEGLLGAGGMAKVYKAKHAILETIHAIKVLDPEYRANPEARKRFLDEAKIQAKHLDHQNIVKVTNIVATNEHAALVMELIDGPSLESYMPKLKGQPGEIKRIMQGVLDGVGYAHKAGIIHRDLKPANVLLAKRGDELIPKVTDFGIAKLTVPDDGKGGKKSTHAAARMGTLSYMSPEQIRRAKDVTARSDVFSLGAMLYELATGSMAFGGDSDYDVMENIVNGRYQLPERKFDQIDPLLASVIQKALETDPADRFASCEEMAAALRGEIEVVRKPKAEKPVEKISETTEAEPQKKPEKAAVAPVTSSAEATGGGSGKTIAIVMVVGALVLGGGAIFLATHGNDTPTTASNAGGSAGSGTVVATATPDSADMATPDAAEMATSDAAAVVAVTPRDAAVVVAKVPKPIDAGVTAGSGSGMGTAGLGKLPAKLDGGVPKIPGGTAGTGSGGKAPKGGVDAGVVVVASPDAGAPAGPNPCGGAWNAGSSFTLNMKPTGCAGSYVIKDTDNGATCSGAFRGCRLQNGSVVATFGCEFTQTQKDIDGTMTISCIGNLGKVNLSLLTGALDDLSFSISR